MGIDYSEIERERGPDGAIYLTPEGVERLRKELEFLQNERMPQVVAWLNEIVSEGVREDDVKGFEEARSELMFIEERIRKLVELLGAAKFLKAPESSEQVQLGSWVTVKDDEATDTYRIVNPAEADPSQGFVSDASPLGKALLGHRAGDSVFVHAPDGVVEFQIVSIR
jgi:transcription elongation factor GreA